MEFLALEALKHTTNITTDCCSAYCLLSSVFFLSSIKFLARTSYSSKIPSRTDKGTLTYYILLIYRLVLKAFKWV